MSKIRYGKIYETTWLDEDFSSISDGSKLMYLYLLSCHEGNSIGMFICGIGYMNTYLKVGERKLKEQMEELETSGLVKFSEPWVYFPNFVKWNQFENSSHAKGAGEVLMKNIMLHAPKHLIKCCYENILENIEYSDKDYSEDFKSKINMKVLNRYIENIQTGCGQGVDRVSTECRDGAESLSTPVNKKQETGNKKQETEILSCESLVEMFNRLCPSLPKVQKVTASRQRAIKKLIADGYTDVSFSTVFGNTEKSDFLCQRNQKADSTFKADFDWILQPVKFQKILEGGYQNNKNGIQSNSWQARGEIAAYRPEDFPDEDLKYFVGVKND